MPRFLCVALACTSALIAPSAAAAARHQSGGRQGRAAQVKVTRASVDSRDPVATAASVALRFWHATPCGGHVTILAAQPLVAGLGPSTDGWVTFSSSLGPDDLSAPASTYTNCTITLARWQWATRTDMEGDWGMFCLTVVHEVGHLLGHAHTNRPGNVMNPVFTNDADVPALCNATWLPGWRNAGIA